MASIPIFGGFCAETDTPDGCMNRFSNEYTLPPPLKSRRFRVRGLATRSDDPAQGALA